MLTAVSLLNLALFLVLAVSVGFILLHVIITRRVSPFICLFLTLPVGHIFMLHSFSYDGWSIFWLFGLLLSLAAHILLLIYTISQEKKTVAEEELRETRHRIELEKSHYKAVELRRERLDKLRREFIGELENVARLTHLGEEETRESIAGLSEKIARTRERPYCALPVINAVLTEKEDACAAADISLSVDLNLPDVLAIEPMHLCSIFSNLMDNAIAACKEISGEKKRVIRLSSKVDGDYLFIKSVNPSGEPPKKRIPGRGYGSRILSDLAARYGGGYQGGYRAGEYTAVLSMLAQPDRGGPA